MKDRSQMKPRVLILYYSFTNQTHRVAEAMAEVFDELDCDVELCNIEFVDEHYRIELPFRPVIRKLLPWLLPQLLGRCGKVRVPEHVIQGDYDFICIGSPTWWLNPAMPIVSFLKLPSSQQLFTGKPVAVFAVCRNLWWNNVRRVKKLAGQQGAIFVDAAAFCFRGNQIQSALSFISYMQNGENRSKYWGVRIYEFGVPEDGLVRARAFARELATKFRASQDAASKVGSG